MLVISRHTIKSVNFKKENDNSNTELNKMITLKEPILCVPYLL